MDNTHIHIRNSKLKRRVQDLEARKIPQVKMWAITYRQKPTFYLHPDIHGILTPEGAAKIGADILGLDSSEGVFAQKVDIDA